MCWLIVVLLFDLFFAVLGIEARASCVLDKATTELLLGPCHAIKVSQGRAER